MSTKQFEYQDIHAEELDSKPLLSRHDISLIADLKVKIDVLVGSAMITIDDLYKLGNGSIITLDQTTDSPVEVSLNGNTIARGILSVVDDHFAVKITEAVNGE